MKKTLLAFMLCLGTIMSYAASLKDLNNGWQLYSNDNELNHNPLNGLYFLTIDEKTDFKIYIDILNSGDTICELFIDSKDEDGNNRVFYTFDRKSTYFFDVYRINESNRFSIVKFEYNENDDFSTGFNQNGLGQNNLAKQIALELLKGQSIKFVATPSMAEYQEIKELIIPGIK